MEILGSVDFVTVIQDIHLSKEMATSVNTEAATDKFAMKLFIVQYLKIEIDIIVFSTPKSTWRTSFQHTVSLTVHQKANLSITRKWNNIEKYLINKSTVCRQLFTGVKHKNKIEHAVHSRHEQISYAQI